MVDGIDRTLAVLAPGDRTLVGEVDAVLARGHHWLRFPAPLEQRFLDDTHVERRRHYRAMVLLAIAAFDLFLVGDYQLIPDIFGLSVLLRLGVITPLALLVAVALRYLPHRRAHEMLVAFSCIGTCETLVVLMVKTGSPMASHYYMGVLLPLIFQNTVQRIRFWYAAGASLVMLLLIGLGTSQLLQLSADVRQTFVLITLATCVFTLLALYRLEYEERSNWLHMLKLAAQRHAVETQRREAERQKDNVEQAHRNIMLLSEIGRQITATLDQDAVLQVLYRHVQQLMDAPIFSLGLYRPGEETLEWACLIVEGWRMASTVQALAEADPLAAWCLRERRELIIEDLATQGAGTTNVSALLLREGNGLPRRHPAAALYEPLLIGDRTVGLITVQSFRRAAYGPVHAGMLRTLASYAAIALDNAHAYRQLGEAQKQLIHQETMASLGRLVAGVAHEVSTPLGNIRMSTSFIQQRLDAFAGDFQAGRLARSAVNDWLQEMRQAVEVLDIASQRAAQQISGFKQLAVDQSSGLSCRFELADTIEVVLKSMSHYLRKSGIAASAAIEPGLVLYGEPGRLEQVVVNLITNAVIHGFGEQGPGGISIQARCLGDEIEMTFSDNGRGMPPSVQSKIFEPFFTTRFGQGGSGLGLYIVHNIVTHGFNGRLRVESEPGQGTTFILLLPAAG